MKLVITETQAKVLMESFNSKPAKLFDQIYGTKLSQSYSFIPYTEKEVQERWDKGIFKGNYVDFERCFPLIEKNFPFVKYDTLDDETKHNILAGMLSGFNVQDIIYFSIKKVPYMLNKPQLELEAKLPPKVREDIGWVLSPHSINILKKKFNITNESTN